MPRIKKRFCFLNFEKRTEVSLPKGKGENMELKFKYFRKKFIFSLVIYIVPIIMLLILLVSNLTGFMVNATRNQIEYKLESILDLTNTNLDFLNNISLDLEKSEILYEEPDANNSYAQMQIRDLLRRNIEKSSFCSDIIFYFRDGNKIFTGENVENAEDFFLNEYVFGDAEKYEIDRWLNKTVVPELVFSESLSVFGKKEDAAVLYVVPLLNKKTEATAIFVLENNWFDGQLKDYYDMYDGGAVLQRAGLNKKLYLGKSLEKNGGRGYEELSVSNDVSGLNMVFRFGKKNVYEPLWHIYFVILIYTIGLLIFGVVLVYRITKRSYRPVAQLKEMIGYDFEDSADEFESIGHIIENIKVKNEQLEEILKNREQKLEKLMLKDMLGFKEYDPKSEGTLFEDFDENKNPLKQTVIFVVSEEKNDFSSKIFSDGEAFSAYELESEEYANARIFLVRFAENISFDIKKRFAEIAEKIKKETGIFSEIIVGKTADSIFDIKSSFISAYNAYLSFNTDKVKIADEDVFYDKYPLELLSGFEKSLNGGRLEDAQKALSKLKDSLGYQLHLFIKRCVIIEIFNIFIRRICTVEDKTQKAELMQYLIEDREAFDICDVDKIFDDFSEYAKMLINKSKEKNSELVSRCCKYIHENFFEYNLTVQNLADMFGVSSTLLNQKMKKELDMNVYEYITSIRMENAVYMLLHTDYSVKTIVEFIGYYDVSSFGRKFKNIYGTSPAEYRKKHKINN